MDKIGLWLSELSRGVRDILKKQNSLQPHFGKNEKQNKTKKANVIGGRATHRSDTKNITFANVNHKVGDISHSN